MRRTALPAFALLLVLARSGAASTAADLCPPAADPCVVSSPRVVTAGSVLDFGTRTLDIQGTGSLTVGGGHLAILAGTVRVESHGKLIGAVSQGTSGSISIVTSDDIRIDTGAAGDGVVDTSASDNPGQIDLTAHRDIVIGGRVDSNANSDPGVGGVINVTSDGNMTVTGAVRAKGGLLGLGGVVTLQAGGTASVTGQLRVDAGDGGDIYVTSMNAGITAAGALNASGGGNIGDGGSVTLLAARDVGVGGSISVGGAGSALEGGGAGGDVDLEGTAGNVSVPGTIDNHGAAPDGDAGDVVITAGVDYVQSGMVLNDSNGTDGCGGGVDIQAGRQADFRGDVDLSGGFCGGDFSAEGGTVSFATGAEVLADGGTVAGSILLTAQQITAGGRLHANGTTATGEGGLVQITACTVGIPGGAQIRTDGVTGENLLQASGQLTIGGLLSSLPSGLNRFEYRDPARPPLTLGTASIQPARDCAPAAGCLTPTLVACSASAVCGNGTRELGEGCDDGNTLACDGCSPTCQTEGCGNGTIECGEECDDGTANGAPGDPCDATCHVVHGTNVVFIPGAHRGGRGCLLEWALANTPAAGFPGAAQTCIDGDPACDQDGVTDGVCTFHVSACLNVTDPRLPKCVAESIDFAKVRRPSPLRPADQVETGNAQRLVDALKTLGVSVRSGDTVLQQGTPDGSHDHCTAAFVQRVPHPPNATGRRLLSTGATALNGDRTANRIALSCLPNPAVCGNGQVEIGEECDDGNRASCDGCSSTCRRERCGDGIIACGEQCDDGPRNGTPGDACSTRCLEVPPPARIPGGSRSTECIGEWSLAGQVLNGRNGLPSPKQTCVDGDPTCDFDPTPGNCRLHLWACVGGDDPRIACAASTVGTVSLVKPSASQAGPAAGARAAILAQLGGIPLPAGPGEVCSGRIDIDLPAGRSRLGLKSEATTIGGGRDRDALKLTCAPAGTALRLR